MPNAVAAAAPSVVMPFSLAISFQTSRNYTVDENTYCDGSVQVLAISSTSRKKWLLTKRLTVAQLAALRTFYLSQLGLGVEFYFYDLWETSPIFTWDPTGASIPGRYIVRFDSQFQQSLDMGRNPVQQLALIEVA